MEEVPESSTVLKGWPSGAIISYSVHPVLWGAPLCSQLPLLKNVLLLDNSPRTAGSGRAPGWYLGSCLRAQTAWIPFSNGYRCTFEVLQGCNVPVLGTTTTLSPEPCHRGIGCIKHWHHYCLYLVGQRTTSSAFSPSRTSPHLTLNTKISLQPFLLLTRKPGTSLPLISPFLCCSLFSSREGMVVEEKKKP